MKILFVFLVLIVCVGARTLGTFEEEVDWMFDDIAYSFANCTFFICVLNSIITDNKQLYSIDLAFTHVINTKCALTSARAGLGCGVNAWVECKCADA